MIIFPAGLSVLTEVGYAVYLKNEYSNSYSSDTSTYLVLNSWPHL